MKARVIYPDSKRAKDGIRRILDRVLPPDGELFDSPEGSAAPTAAGRVEESLPPAPASGPPADPFN